MKFKTAPVSVKAVDADTGVFEAVVSVFGNEDSYGDIVMPGAFAKTLQDWAAKGDPIPVYWSHRMDDPDYNIGHVLEASETDAGLLVKAQLDLGGGKADQVHRLLKGRRVTQFSFAYDVIAEVKNGDANELHELKLYEVGPTPIGANQETELLAVKAAYALSTKSETDVREAIDALTAATKQLQELLPVNPDPEAEVEQKASGTDPANAEEPSGANAEEPGRSPSAKTFAQIQLLALAGQEVDSQ